MIMRFLRSISGMEAAGDAYRPCGLDMVRIILRWNESGTERERGETEVDSTISVFCSWRADVLYSLD